jgi:hypothetical protein
MFQLASTVEKNFIEKKRNIRVTVCEYCSHLVIVMILFLGYGASVLVKYPAAQYDSLNVQIPPSFLKISANSSSTNELINFKRLVNSIQGTLNGPLQAPSFDTFVGLSQYATKNLNTNSDIVNTILSTSFGQKFGNILDFGALHFAPYPSVQVKSLIDHLNKTTLTFSNLKYFLHESEEAAVKFILHNLNIKTFALIVLREITPHKINYVIRMNYTTLPRTTAVVLRTGVFDDNYQSYFLSGFLTLQVI